MLGTAEDRQQVAGRMRQSTMAGAWREMAHHPENSSIIIFSLLHSGCISKCVFLMFPQHLHPNTYTAGVSGELHGNSLPMSGEQPQRRDSCERYLVKADEPSNEKSLSVSPIGRFA